MKIVMLGNDTKEEIEKRLQVVAAAGNLSRADGTVTQVFESRNDYEANLKLARAVVGYGHKSIAEHDYLVFAIEEYKLLNGKIKEILAIINNTKPNKNNNRARKLIYFH